VVPADGQTRTLHDLENVEWTVPWRTNERDVLWEGFEAQFE
jgi:hypothetical protein